MTTARVFGLLGLMLAGCNDDRVTTIAALTGDEAAGLAVYGRSCRACHGIEGEGGIGDSLIDAAPGFSEEDMITIIIMGQGDMPPQTTLQDQDVADVTAYVRAEWGGS